MTTLFLLGLLAQGCTTPDPFAAIGGGLCLNGGWIPNPAPVVQTQPPPPVWTYEAPVRVQAVKGKVYTVFISATEQRCTGGTIATTWRNDYGQSIFLRSLSVWVGANEYAIADIQHRVWVSGDVNGSMPIYSHSWDHYQPSNWHDRFQQKFEDYVELVPGGWITVDLTCATVAGMTGSATAQFQFYFNTVRP